MTSAATAAGRFVRRTSLGDDEYRVNFKQIDSEVLKALASDEACAVTPSMSKIYLRLLLAPISCWEREGVLRFVGEEREGETLTAWGQLVELTGVANSTLSKALKWMHDTGVIGYHPRKNGVGIRIFFNRASSSIRKREQKILRLVPSPSDRSPAPSDGVPFKEEYSGENLDKGINPRAPSRAATTPASTDLPSPSDTQQSRSKPHDAPIAIGSPAPFDLAQVVGMVKREIEPVIASMCGDAISSACRKEAALNREWLEEKGIPKAIRVAQREAFDVLRSHGVITKKGANDAYVGLNNAALGTGKRVLSAASTIADFLGGKIDAIRRVASDGAVAEEPALQAAFSEVEAELGDLRGRVAIGDGGMLPDLEEIEAALAALEDRIVGALWEATDPQEIECMLKAAAADFRRYETTMEPAVYRDTLRRRVMAGLRKRHGVPCLSLFYM